MADPYQVVRDFEAAVAEFAGARYGVATDSCSNAILLSLLYRDVKDCSVLCPRRTYPSVPAAILHAGGKITWWPEGRRWKGTYELRPYGIVDAAKRFCRGMYYRLDYEEMCDPGEATLNCDFYREPSRLVCVSFHAKKHLPIGRGGMVLTDDEAAARWLRKARFDGRDEVPLSRQEPSDVLGYNCYMTPEAAARGLTLLGAMVSRGDDNLPDQVESPDYPDLSLWPCFRQGESK